MMDVDRVMLNDLMPWNSIMILVSANNLQPEGGGGYLSHLPSVEDCTTSRAHLLLAVVRMAFGRRIVRPSVRSSATTCTTSCHVPKPVRL